MNLYSSLEHREEPSKLLSFREAHCPGPSWRSHSDSEQKRAKRRPEANKDTSDQSAGVVCQTGAYGLQTSMANRNSFQGTQELLGLGTAPSEQE